MPSPRFLATWTRKTTRKEALLLLQKFVFTGCMCSAATSCSRSEYSHGASTYWDCWFKITVARKLNMETVTTRNSNDYLRHFVSIQRIFVMTYDTWSEHVTASATPSVIRLLSAYRQGYFKFIFRWTSSVSTQHRLSVEYRRIRCGDERERERHLFAVRLETREMWNTQRNAFWDANLSSTSYSSW